MNFENPPVFIIGAPRSGTTYLRELLNHSSSIRLTYEIHFVREGYRILKQINPENNQEKFFKFLSILIPPKSEIPGPEPKNGNVLLSTTIEENKMELWDLWVKHKSYGILVSYIYQKAYGKPIWGDKMVSIESAGNILKIWPNAKILIIFRDPRANVSSQLEQHYNKLEIASQAAFWNMQYNLGFHYLNKFPNNCHKVIYEDLVAKPEETLTTILDFIQPDLKSELGIILEKSPPAVESLSKWKVKRTEAEIKLAEEYCYNGMRSLGYKPLYAKSSRKINKVTFILNLYSAYKKRLSFSYILRKNLFSRLLARLKYSGVKN